MRLIVLTELNNCTNIVFTVLDSTGVRGMVCTICYLKCVFVQGCEKCFI